MSKKQNAAAYESADPTEMDHTHDNLTQTINYASVGRCSVRELESISNHLRHTGKHNAAERIDARIMAMLEKKIYQKLIAQNRRQRILKPVAVV
ncbi:MAG: hypothetical protein KZQ73_14110 [Candidatus Thiodiazotropha sp. (ex Semelilucina semeliformis)]|nr:hypothetical protein [Candidatus Thiodiazotropha sp. (ex Semelilucina semeliformis)]